MRSRKLNSAWNVRVQLDICTQPGAALPLHVFNSEVMLLWLQAGLAGWSVWGSTSQRGTRCVDPGFCELPRAEKVFAETWLT